MSNKKCTSCKEVKPLSAYYKASRYASGYSSQCKECQRRKARERARNKGENNKDPEREKMRNKRVYLKSEEKKKTKYYFLFADNCMCNDVEGECMYCSIKSSPIKKHIEKNDEDFWDERTIMGVDYDIWKKKVEAGAEVIHF